MTNRTTLTIGTNRGAARLWIQGGILIRAGWTPGRRWRMSVASGTGCILLEADPDGPRKVAGNDARPVIDSKDPRIGELFEPGDRVAVSVLADCIRVEPA